MAQERGGAATVVAHEEDRLRVEYRGERLTIPMRGFPPGFRLHPKDRVILVDEEGGPVARPLVRALTSRLSPGAIDRRGSVEAAGRQLEMQPGTIVEERPAAEGETGEYAFWIVETADAGAADRVIAVRRQG